MISVITSTRQIDNKFVEMVKKMSGINDIEVLMYENNGEMSLTEVYNKGLKESKNDIVVFMHDDINILTKDWGKKLVKHYQNTDYGILGVAGSKNLNENGVWWTNRESMYGNVYHTDGKKTWLSEYSYNFGNRIKEAVVVDGVFFSCSKKRIVKDFDEFYKGFHFYDISFCFDNFKENVKVGVHFDISIVHKSVGEVNDEWEKNRLLFMEKEKENLPEEAVIDVIYTEPNIKIKKERKLAIVIPTKNNVDELLIQCIESIIGNTTYKNYKIYIADTGSSDLELDKLKEYIKNTNSEEGRDVLKLTCYDYYNFGKINNNMVNTVIDKDSELLLFCNNDIEMLNDAISILVEAHERNKRVGTVGARLHYENGSIQHLGIMLQETSKGEMKINHNFAKWDNENVRSSSTEIYSHGNTAAFMLVSKSLFNEIGGFNEVYADCYEDVEFNLQCILKKKANITSNRAVCYHFEAQTRGKTDNQSDLTALLKFVNLNPEIRKTFNKIN